MLEKPRHFTHPDMRFLDQLIRQLTERVEWLEAFIAGLKEGSETFGVSRGDLSPEPEDTIINLSSPSVSPEPHDRDETAVQAIQEVADALQPDRYYLRAEGYGWFTVRAKGGEAVHEGKLRKADAQHMLDELLNPKD